MRTCDPNPMVRTLKAKVANGRLAVDEPTSLPEGTELNLIIADGWKPTLTKFSPTSIAPEARPRLVLTAGSQPGSRRCSLVADQPAPSPRLFAEELRKYVGLLAENPELGRAFPNG
jgi:hypothetical protein